MTREQEILKTIRLIEQNRPDYTTGLSLIGGLTGYFLSKRLGKDFYPYAATGAFVGFCVGRALQKKAIDTAFETEQTS